jgi:hypothetical protein
MYYYFFIRPALIHYEAMGGPAKDAHAWNRPTGHGWVPRGPCEVQSAYVSVLRPDGPKTRKCLFHSIASRVSGPVSHKIPRLSSFIGHELPLSATGGRRFYYARLYGAARPSKSIIIDDSKVYVSNQKVADR